MTISRRTLLNTAAALAVAAPSRAAEKTRITLWHAMSAALGEELNKLVAAFNAGQDAVEVTPSVQGCLQGPAHFGGGGVARRPGAAYRAGVRDRHRDHADLGSGDQADLAARAGHRREHRCGRLHPRGARLLQHVRTASSRRCRSIPPPRSPGTIWTCWRRPGSIRESCRATWQEVETAMRTVRQKDAAPFGVTIASVVWSQFEQYGAIHNLPFATEANGFKGLDAVLKVNSPPFVKHLQRLIDMAKDNSFHYTGRDGVGDGAFINGQSAMACSTSALRGDLQRSAKFRWAPAFLPYDPEVIREPINSAIGGASFWVLTAPKRRRRRIPRGGRVPALRRPAAAGCAMEHGHRLCADHPCRLRAAAEAGLVRTQPRHRPAGEAAHPRRGHRQFARLPSRPDAGDPHHHRGGVRDARSPEQQGAKQALDSAVERGNKVLRDFQKSVHT